MPCPYRKQASGLARKGSGFVEMAAVYCSITGREPYCDECNRCKECGTALNPIQMMMGNICGDCVRKAHREAIQ